MYNVPGIRDLGFSRLINRSDSKRASLRKGRAFIAILLPVLFGFGPCGPIAGTELSGEQVSEKIADFRFVNDVDDCALEVNSADPHSVTVNCWTVGKQLFIGCKECEGKKWSRLIDADQLARVRIGERVYPVKATKMSDLIAIQRAWTRRLQKYGDDEPETVPEGYWLYHIGSKPRT